MSQAIAQSYLVEIVRCEQAWEQAHSLLSQHVNDIMNRLGANVQLRAAKTPAGLSLDQAISRLNVTTNRLGNFIDMPGDFLTLMVGELPVAITHAAAADWYLERVGKGAAQAKVTPWQSSIIDPNKKAAQQFRDWFALQKQRAKQQTLSDVARKALRAMTRLKAFTRESRQSIPAIAKEAEKPKYPNIDAYRVEMPSLVEMGLAETKEGRGGGAWLTPEGRQIAKTSR